MAPVDDADTIQRPATHVGGELPPLRPCADARTPLERLQPPPGSEAAAVAAASPAPANTLATAFPAAAEAAATPDGVPNARGGSNDVLERLRELHAREANSANPDRHWGEPETAARQALEDFAHSEGDDREEANARAISAIREAAPTAVDADAFSLLHYSAMYGCVDALSSLMKKKANVNARTKMHESPLQLAAYYRHHEACAVLLAHRARADLADWQGRTPLVAAKASKCGNGSDNNGQAQARCVELLAARAAQEAAWREGTPAESPDQVAFAATLASGATEAAKLRQQGNEAYSKGHFKDALAAYSLALSFFDNGVIYSNRAECYLKLGKAMEAKMDAQKAVGLAGDDGNKKASWRLGRACLALGEISQAAEAARVALKLWPEDAALKQLAVDVEKERRKRL